MEELTEDDVLVDSVKRTEEDTLELRLTVLSDVEALLRVSDVDGLTDQEIEKLTEGDMLVDSVKLVEKGILELKLSVLADKEAVLDACDVDGLTDEEME